LFEPNNKINYKFLGAFTKMRKQTMSIVMCICPFFCLCTSMKDLSATGRVSMKFALISLPIFAKRNSAIIKI